MLPKKKVIMLSIYVRIYEYVPENYECDLDVRRHGDGGPAWAVRMR